MSKYIGSGMPTVQQKTNPIPQVMENISNQLREIRQESILKDAIKVINDPNSTPIQKAMALGSIGQDKLGTEVFKKAADQSALSDIEARLNKNLGRGPTQQPRDRSWVPDMSGRTPTIREGGQENTAQPGAEGVGSITQPGFSTGGPQNASRNATALNVPSPPPMRAPAPVNAPAGAPAPVDPEQEALAYEQAALEAAAKENVPVSNRYSDIAKDIRKDIRHRKDAAIKAKEFEQTVFQRERDYNTQVSKPFREQMSGLAESIPRSEAALSMARTAIESGDIGPLSVNNLANILGRPELATASGGALNFAMKQNLLGTLSEVSARAQNKWLEQMAYGAFPGIGKSQANNLTLQEAVEAELALKKAKFNIYNQLSQADQATKGYVGADIEQRVNNAFFPIAKDIADRTSYRTRVLYEEEKGDKALRRDLNKKPPHGAPLTRRMFQILLKKTGAPDKAIERAKQLGYVIYPNAKVEEYTQ